MQSTSPAIGLVENFQFRSAQIHLIPGDLLLLYTDGVTEANNRKEEEFGTAGLAKTIAANRTFSAGEVLTSVQRAILHLS